MFGGPSASPVRSGGPASVALVMSGISGIARLSISGQPEMMSAQGTSQRKGKAAMADDSDHSPAQAGETISHPSPATNPRREWHRPVITLMKLEGTLFSQGSGIDGPSSTP